YPEPPAGPSLHGSTPAVFYPKSWVAPPCGDQCRFLKGVGNSDDPIDEDPGGDDHFRIDIADLHQGASLDDGRPGGHRHDRSEVACRFVVDQVAIAVGAFALDQGEVGFQAELQDIFAAIEMAVLLPLGQGGAD